MRPFSQVQFILATERADKVQLKQALEAISKWPIYSARTETGRRKLEAERLLSLYPAEGDGVDWCVSVRKFLKRESYEGSDIWVGVLDSLEGNTNDKTK